MPARWTSQVSARIAAGRRPPYERLALLDSSSFHAALQEESDLNVITFIFYYIFQLFNQHHPKSLWPVESSRFRRAAKDMRRERVLSSHVHMPVTLKGYKEPVPDKSFFDPFQLLRRSCLAGPAFASACRLRRSGRPIAHGSSPGPGQQMPRKCPRPPQFFTRKVPNSAFTPFFEAPSLDLAGRRI